jgi:hypothetical protein
MKVCVCTWVPPGFFFSNGEAARKFAYKLTFKASFVEEVVK